MGIPRRDDGGRILYRSGLVLFLSPYGMGESNRKRIVAVLKQLGNDGAALFTMFLGIMTLVPTMWPSVLMGNRGRRAVLGMIAFVVVFWLFMITIPATTIDHYYGSTG